MEKSNYKIIIAGEGGQGVQSIAHAFATAAYKANLNISYMPNYGVEQRGGVSLGFLQIGTGIIGFPKFAKADIVLVMCRRAIDRIVIYLADDTLFLYDSDQLDATDLAKIRIRKKAIPATSEANKKLEQKVFNMILAGTLLAEIKVIKKEYLFEALDQIFADKYQNKPKLKPLNRRAVEIGIKLADRKIDV